MTMLLMLIAIVFVAGVILHIAAHINDDGVDYLDFDTTEWDFDEED